MESPAKNIKSYRKIKNKYAKNQFKYKQLNRFIVKINMQTLRLKVYYCQVT